MKDMPPLPDAISVREATFRLTLQGGRITTLSAVSHGVQALLGYSAEDFLSNKIALPQLIHADDLDIAETLFSPAFSGNMGDCNLRIRQANGRILCVKGHYRHEAAANGIVLELRLQDAKTLPRTMASASTMPVFVAILENTDDYIYFKDRNHVFTGASQTLVALCSPAEHWSDLIGQTDYDVFPEQYADIYYRLEKQVFAGHAVAHEEQETLGKGGEKGWVDNRKYPIHDADGTIIGLYGIARDITAIKQAQEALAASEMKARATLDGIPLPMAINDNRQRITYLNQAFTQTFGYSLQDIPTLADWWPIAYPDPAYRQWVAESWERELAQAKQTGMAFKPIEIRVRCKDGRERIVMAAAVRFMAHFEDTHLVTLFDITDRKLTEQALQQKAENLQASNAELEQFNLTMVGRELRMIELKEEVNALCRRLGEPPRYEMDILETERFSGVDQAPAGPGGGGA